MNWSRQERNKVRVRRDSSKLEEVKMPIYEYWCGSCHKKVSLYQREFSSSPSCPHCGSSKLKRIFSTFSVHKTYKDVYENILSDRELTQSMMHNDPRALAEWNKRMSGGEKVAPEYEEIVERMGRGEQPAEQIKERRKEFLVEE